MKVKIVAKLSKVKIVSSDTLKINILEKITSLHNDETLQDSHQEEYKVLKKLIENVDLVERGVRYHDFCLRKFSIFRPSHQAGRPMGKDTSDVVEYIPNKQKSGVKEFFK